MSYVERTGYSGSGDASLAGKPLQVRLLYALGVGILGGFAFNALILLGIAQFIYIALNKSRNEEIAHFSRDLLGYLAEVLAFISFLDDRPPFPFAPFPATERK